MIYYPIQMLVDAGVEDIMVVTGGRNSGDNFLRLLGNGKLFGLKHINYTYQEGKGGIIEALGLAEHFADGEKICVVLGDNIIQRDIRRAVDEFSRTTKNNSEEILLKAVPEPKVLGVAEVKDDDGQYRGKAGPSGIELRGHPGSTVFDATRLFEKMKMLVPSKRGELEITGP